MGDNSPWLLLKAALLMLLCLTGLGLGWRPR